MTWPREGRCGACGRRAWQFPSGNWEHDGSPCRARSQTAFSVDDIPVSQATRFIAVGEPLPTVSGSVRAMLAEEAE